MLPVVLLSLIKIKLPLCIKHFLCLISISIVIQCFFTYFIEKIMLYLFKYKYFQTEI